VADVRPRILQHPEPTLRSVSLPVTDFSEVPEIVAQMHAALTNSALPPCIGLAAVQIGILKRVVIVKQGTQWITLVNPVITDIGGEQSVRDGCMSVDFGSTFRQRTRPAFIRIRYQDELGNEQRRKAKGIHAAAIAHELDHLEGVLFLDALQEVA
jgi:peptide deformylase